MNRLRWLTAAAPFVQPDGLHPTAAGSAWLTTQINAAVAS